MSIGMAQLVQGLKYAIGKYVCAHRGDVLVLLVD